MRCCVWITRTRSNYPPFLAMSGIVRPVSTPSGMVKVLTDCTVVSLSPKSQEPPCSPHRQPFPQDPKNIRQQDIRHAFHPVRFVNLFPISSSTFYFAVLSYACYPLPVYYSTAPLTNLRPSAPPGPAQYKHTPAQLDCSRPHTLYSSEYPRTAPTHASPQTFSPSFSLCSLFTADCLTQLISHHLPLI
jgi:hypothetical protein